MCTCVEVESAFRVDRRKFIIKMVWFCFVSVYFIYFFVPAAGPDIQKNE